MLLNILLGLLILVAVSLTAIVLLQRSEGGALGMGGGGQLMSARGAGNLLTRTTQILGAVFFILALAITILTGRQAGSGSVVDRLKIEGIDPSLLNRQQAPAPAQAPATAPPPTGGFFPAPAPSTGVAPATAPAAPAPAAP